MGVTPQERLAVIEHALADPDLLYDHKPAEVERMQKEKQSLEVELKELEDLGS
jgi:hypothetical protein